MYFATRGLYALMESNLPSVTSVQKHRALSFWRLFAEPTPSSRYCPSASSTLLSISVFRSLFYHYRLATETEFGGGGSPVVASRVVSYFLAFFSLVHPRMGGKRRTCWAGAFFRKVQKCSSHSPSRPDLSPLTNACRV